jgi:hypothetical protein
VNNQQIATAHGSLSGTGLLYTAYEQGSDSAVWKNGSGATRSTLALKRTQPKPTPTFPGVERIELKRTNYVTVGTSERTVVVTIGISVPADVPLADRQSAILQAMLSARATDINSCLADGVFPT